MMPWQPIDTAPKDGTKLLCACDSGLIILQWVAGYWCPPFDSSFFFHPTHWMPIPTAPGTDTINIADVEPLVGNRFVLNLKENFSTDTINEFKLRWDSLMPDKELIIVSSGMKLSVDNKPAENKK